MKQGTLWALVAIIVVVGLVVWAGGSGTSAPAKGQGKVVVAITDAAADIKNVSEIKMKVSKVELHSQAEGWVTVTGSNREFDLLTLKNQNRWELAARENIKADTYDQVRLMVSSVTVVKTDGSTESAKLPSGELKINSAVTVRDQETSTVAIDVMGDTSLHVTGSGKYIFAPVVRVESRANAEAMVASDDSVTISGGSLQSTVNAGMDVNGEVKNNFQLDSTVKLDIDTSGVININSALNSGINVNLNGSGSADTKTNVKVDGSLKGNLGY